MIDAHPKVQVRTLSQDGAELDKVHTAINVVPEELGLEHAPLVALLDAIRRYYEAYPTLAAIEIEIYPAY